MSESIDATRESVPSESGFRGRTLSAPRSGGAPSDHQPYVPDNTSVPEFTFQAVLAGAVLGIMSHRVSRVRWPVPFARLALKCSQGLAH